MCSFVSYVIQLNCVLVHDVILHAAILYFLFANIVPRRGALMARGHTKEKGPHAGGAVLFVISGASKTNRRKLKRL